MRRLVSEYLTDWLGQPARKPMILRGARQVGKTWLVRELARSSGRALVEVNLERRPELADHFAGNAARRAIADLGIDLGVQIRPESALLFLDEIQATPQMLGALRWLGEDVPELPVIAAGSLLDFALREPAFSVPVGRITYCHVEPMSFYEFLDACGQAGLHTVLRESVGKGELGSRLHARALELFAEFCLVGGLPEVVADWTEHRDDDRRLRLQRDLLATYRDDFNKYRDRIPADLLRRVMDSTVRQLGKRFIYSQVDADSSHRELKKAAELLFLARVCHPIEHTAANGLPLGAEGNPRLLKSILVDVGLASVQLGLSRLRFRDLNEVVWSNRGGLAEQFVGQHLRCLARPYEERRLFFWQRAGGRPGEIDYVLQEGGRIVPIEVKAGASGAMKSLHAFMQEKELKLAARFDTNPPSIQDMKLRTTTGEEVGYRLTSLPLYMVESLPLALLRHGTPAG